MVKYLLVLVFTANAIFLVSSAGRRESGSFSNGPISPAGQCHGHGYQDATSSSVSSSSSSSHSSSSSSSSSSATSIDLVASPISHPDCRTCRTNERWVRCPEAVCVPKTCDDVGFPVPCYDLTPDGKCPSKPACICEEGYVRNSKGVCVPMKHCPSCGGDPNAESGCGLNCNRLCSNYNKQNVSCEHDCLYNGCDCKRGYVFDEFKKKCVHPSKCTPPLKCKKRNEVYDPCPAPCPFRTCGINDAAVSCIRPLPDGHPDCAPPKCRCRDGFYRNDVGDCVRWEDCPTCNNPNEMYDPCPAPCPPRRCDVNEALILCAVPPQLGDPACEPGCRCIDGYVKDYAGVCIPKDQCPKCPLNEVFDACIVPCPPRRCDVDERLIKCAPPPPLGDPLCQAGCRCADGFKRNYEGVCIPADECPKCPLNEVFDPCIAPCPPRRCDVDERLIRCAAPPQLGDPRCEAGCRCADGYKRNNEGVCIPADECPKCTQPHEVFDPCPNACPPQTCESIGKIYHCPLENAKKGTTEIVDGVEVVRICDGKCVCEEGYFRNKIGECISKDDCLKCRGPHEYFSCGSACDNVCGLLDQQNQTNCPIVNLGIVCNPMCYCEQGYARDDNHICIPIKDCKAPNCGPDERYEICPPYMCQPSTCTEVGFPVACPDSFGQTCPGKSACVCKDDYVRDERGVCIPRYQCPSCRGDPNQVAGCGVYCNQRCRDVGKKPGACILLCYPNGCDCRKGYFLDENTDKCVRPEHCTPQCPYNEVYTECIQGHCGAKNCTQLGFPTPFCPRIDPKYCKTGCLCKPGYLRNDDGICVPVKECPSCGGDPNAEAGCGKNCNKHCSDIGKEPGVCTLECKINGCDCKEGYYLDNNTNKCVKPENCTPQCPANETYNECMQGDCRPQTCDQLGFPVACPRIDPKYCKKGCLCVEGFVRNKDGRCIPESDCPPQCPANETYNECMQGDCRPQTCDQLGFPVACPRIDPKYCKKGCVCDQGFVRNKDGRCIPARDCPTCRGDPNQIAGCGVYCNQRCRDIGMEPGACILICYENACDCRYEGYYLDENTGKCVLPKDCTPTCGVNEEYNDCANANCNPQNCTQLGFPIPGCPRLENPETCCGECQCISGYARNYKGVCVPVAECPSCGGDPNAVAGCSNHCNRRCSDIGKEPGACAAFCLLNGCDCKEGLFYDDNTKKCVKPENCTPTCGINEEYNECVNARCGPESCKDLGYPVPCVDIDPKYCTKGCRCQPGYVRNDEGVCISSKECPSCGGDPNAQSGCGGHCNGRCSDIGKKPGACILLCEINGCDCKEGYYYDDYTKKCVKPKDCSKGPICLEANNEIYSDCINGGCQAKNCSQYGKPVPCIKIDPKYCIKGCLCKEGYLRAANGKCIPERECPEACNGPNEEYNECSWDCPPQTCESLDKAYSCPAQSDNNCRPMCKCKPGYFRNKIGECITEEECRRCMGPYEYYTCGGACDNVCETLDEQSQDNCPIINIKCNEMCYCERGYARAKNNTCIPICSCDEPQCPINERYESCPGLTCEPQYCSELGYPIPCPAVPADGRCPKKPACVCIDGYVRNDEGRCIPIKECPSCGGDPNAQSGCGVNCEKHCTDLGKEVGCIDVCYPNACDCRDGYYYDSNYKKCVLATECTGICGKNEVFEDCTNPICFPKNCSQLGFSFDCESGCQKGCVCKSGYIRDDNGRCIPVNQCPSCGGDPNAESGCGGNCGKRCSDLGKKPGPCPLACRLNGCDCRDGFYYDSNIKKCVKPEDCNKGPVCLEENNEVYSDCINGGCGWKNCSQYGTPVACVKIDPKYCIKGCLCKEGYLRASNGKCIPQDRCPEACNGPNEEYQECTFDCPPRTCESLDMSYVCPIREGEECFPMCGCKPGYYRSNVGLCITEEQCRMCQGPHEYYACGGACDNVCKTIHKQNQTHCPIINIKCNEMCYCEEGYARAKNNTCIPISSCNEPQCPINERYEKCPPALCQPQRCSQLGKPIPCPAQPFNGRCPTKPGCVCNDGYVRNDKGKCIPKKECPSCGGDSNAESACGVNCGKNCKDLVKDEVSCIEICYFNSCDCKDGYYYDSKQKKCVLPGECTDVCGKNEYFEDCSNPICRAKNCTQLGLPIDCDSSCVKGCACKDGYARDNKGRCIPVKQCRPVCLEENNEVYSDCINGGCGWKNCSQYGTPVACVKIDPKYCIKGCLCKEGYLRASNGKCIPQDRCPEACNGPNEEYQECTFDCPPRTCESLDMSYVCPIREGEECFPMCGCKPGYYRSNVGLCITEEQCRMCQGPHEYYACGGACDNVCKTIHKQNQTHCPIINIKCNEMCYCEEGYARAKNNTCIPISSCNEPQCPINERYEKCPPALCQPQRCSQLGKPIPCPAQPFNGRCPTKPGCVCNDGYVRNDKGKCIPKKECPSCGGDSNAESACGVNCGKNCKDLVKDEVSCIEICYFNSCDCKDGYYYDSKQKKCVLPGECTDVCGKNEYFEDCSNPICRAKNCTQLGLPIDCDSSCVKGCACKDGYARDNKGRCIPVKQCPSCGGDPNAESGCGVNCLKKCYDLEYPDRPRPCPKICKVNSCDCKKEYYLDENIGKCVLPDDCSPTCGDNEIYNSCVNGGCDMRNCSQLGGPQLCIDPIECFGGCVCKEGYLRLKNGTCVPIDQCPPPKCNKKNERFSICPAKECQPQSCRDIGFSINCPDQNATCPGPPACICDYGYVRNNKGICRPKSECPSCGGDSNAQAGCGINCGKRCPNNNLNPKLCPRICLPNACDCKENFFYDINIKKCVRHKDCSPRCEELDNEVYDSCVNGGCGWRNCSEVGGPILCIDPIECKPGCRCKENYYRLDNGKCVPKDQCPLNCWGPNEVYDPCPPKCPPQTCESVGRVYFCPRQNPTDCQEQCRCKPNFYRNIIGECICADDCLKCDGPHEYFSYYGRGCDNVCCKLDTESKDNCQNNNGEFVPQCYCEDGYARNENGICIPFDQCPGRATTTTTTSKPTVTPAPSVNATVAIAKFERGNQVLAMKLLNELRGSRSDENFMVSGFSLLLALAQLALYSVGLAAQQLLSLLNLDKYEIKAAFPILIKNYKSQQEVIFELGVKTYANQNMPLTKHFIEDSTDIFESEVQNVDFSRNEEAAATINKWVEESTHGLIKDLVSASALNADTSCVLANFLYFLGNWEKQFNKNNTKPGDFYTSKNTVNSIDIMHLKSYFGYAEIDDLDCKVLELPYKAGNFSFIVFLPNEYDGLSNMLEKLQENSDLFPKSINSLSRQDVNVSLPVMDVTTDVSDMTNILKKIGITEPFIAGAHSFEGITENGRDLFISDILQKTKIEVTETGTEAAAATAVVLMTRALKIPSNTYDFNANHPFAFFITFGSSNSVVFAGCFVK